MARIRNIKPEFWDDEDLGQVSRDCRLLFIGLWNQADKAGRLEDRPARLRARLFPYDQDLTDAILSSWIDALEAGGFVRRYEGNSKRLIQIAAFTRHQYLSKHEPESTLPPAPEGSAQDETRTVPVPDEYVPGETGRFDKGQLTRDKGQLTREEGDAGEAGFLVDVFDFAHLWNAIVTPPIASCAKVTSKRQAAIRARLKDRSLADWEGVMRRIQRSPFCRGQNDRGWAASIDWILQPDTAVKVLEGKYDGRPTAAVARAIGPNVGGHWWDDCQHDPRCETLSQHQLLKAREPQP